MVLVLGAGGPVGFAFHAGILAALLDAGWDARGADAMVGTSIGAVAVGLLRAGMSPADLFARACDGPLSDSGGQLVERAGGWPVLPDPPPPRWGRSVSLPLLASLLRHPDRIRPGLVAASLTAPGPVDPGPVGEAFERLVSGRWPASTHLCAVDMATGRRAVFGPGGGLRAPFGVAVAASCAVPSYFAPVTVAGRRYIDGGVHSPANTDLAAGVRPDAVVVSLPMGIDGPPGRRGWDLPGRRLNSAGARAGLRSLVARGVPVLVVEPTGVELEVMRFDAFDRSHLAEVAVRARQTLVRRASSPSPADGPVIDVLSRSS